MTVTSDVLPQAAAAPARLARTRPFFWSVRRELWENRAIYLAAPIAAGLVILATVFGHVMMLRHLDIGADRPDAIAMAVVLPYIFAAGAITLTSCIVGVFYCLASLNAERRDRSVLFWKSLPVSDLTAVISKAFVPAVIMPIVTLATIFVTSLVMLGLDFGFGPAHDLSPSEIMGYLPLGQIWLDLVYGFVVLSLWWAPIWSWLLLVSAWSKRMTFLWAVAPPLAICIFERMSVGTDYAWKLLRARMLHGADIAFSTPPAHEPLALPWPDPVPFLASPGLWIGLVLAAAFLAGAVWLRRRREPI